MVVGPCLKSMIQMLPFWTFPEGIKIDPGMAYLSIAADPYL